MCRTNGKSFICHAIFLLRCLGVSLEQKGKCSISQALTLGPFHALILFVDDFLSIQYKVLQWGRNRKKKRWPWISSRYKDNTKKLNSTKRDSKPSGVSDVKKVFSVSPCGVSIIPQTHQSINKTDTYRYKAVLYRHKWRLAVYSWRPTVVSAGETHEPGRGVKEKTKLFTPASPERQQLHDATRCHR